MRGLPEAQRRVWRAFLAARSAVLSQIELELSGVGDLSIGELDVLHQLSLHDGPLRMSELADLTHASRSGLTRRVDRLVGRGYVERANVPDDRRGAYAVLTEAGRRQHDKVMPFHLATVQDVFMSVLREDELELLADALERLAEAASTVVQFDASRA